jgi:Alpha 1,4-glycosyltransferase conserved region
VTKYDPKTWIANGPQLISECIQYYCSGTQFTTNKRTKCEHVMAFEEDKCYPRPVLQYQQYYEEKSAQAVKHSIRDKGSFFIHLWNKMLTFSKNYRLMADSKAALLELAKVYCPKVEATKSGFM